MLICFWRFVHGGATAAMVDTITAVFVNKALGKSSMTANLNINYRRWETNFFCGSNESFFFFLFEGLSMEGQQPPWLIPLLECSFIVDFIKHVWLQIWTLILKGKNRPIPGFFPARWSRPFEGDSPCMQNVYGLFKWSKSEPFVNFSLYMNHFGWTFI